MDTHTGGEPTRTVVSGVPFLPGSSIAEKMIYLSEHYDWIRTLLTHEPRGCENMAGVILTEPCDPTADVGIIHFETGCYQPMCGHNTIGVSTMLIETGRVPVTEPYTEITLETPAGLVHSRVLVKDAVAKEVSFTNIPAFVMAQDICIELDHYGSVKVDVSYGGNIYALFDTSQIGVTISPENTRLLRSLYHEIIEKVNQKGEFSHPEKPFISGVTHVEFYSAPQNPVAHAKNAVCFPPEEFDRSPCGTGSSAKVALLYQQGKLKLGEEFVHESIVGSLFRCKAIETTKVGSYPAVITEITGSAWITGMHTFFIDPDDPFPAGFRL